MNPRDIVGEMMIKLGLDATDVIVQLSDVERKALPKVQKFAKDMIDALAKGDASFMKRANLAQKEADLLNKLLATYAKLGVSGNQAYNLIAAGAAQSVVNVKALAAAEADASKRRQAMIKADMQAWTAAADRERDNAKVLAAQRRTADIERRKAEAAEAAERRRIAKEETQRRKEEAQRASLIEAEASRRRREALAYDITAQKEAAERERQVAALRSAADREAVNKRNASIKEHEAALKAAADRELELQRAHIAKIRHLRQAGQDMRSAGFVLTAGVTAPIVAGGAALLNTAGDLEIQRQSLSRFVGGLDEAEVTIKRVRRVVLDAGNALRFDDALEGVRRLEVLKVSSRDSVSTLRTLANAVAATGGSSDSFSRIIKALDDVKNKGKLSAEEVRQFVNANINVFELLEMKLGKTRKELVQMMRDGEIDSATAIEAILSGLDQKYKGELERRANTFKGMLAQTRNEFVFAMQDVGETFLPTAKEGLTIVRGLASAAVEVTKAFATMHPAVQGGTVAVAGAAALAGPMLILGGNVVTAAASVADMTLKLKGVAEATTAWRLALMALSGVGLVTVSVGMAFGGFAALQSARRSKEFNRIEAGMTDAETGFSRSAGAQDYNAGDIRGSLGLGRLGAVAGVPTGALTRSSPEQMAVINSRIRQQQSEEQRKAAITAHNTMMSTLGVIDYPEQIKNMSDALEQLSRNKDGVWALAAALQNFKNVLEDAAKSGVSPSTLNEGNALAQRLADKNGISLRPAGFAFPTRQFTMPDGTTPSKSDLSKYRYRDMSTPAPALNQTTSQALFDKEYFTYLGSMTDLSTSLSSGFKEAGAAVDEFDRALSDLGVTNTTASMKTLYERLKKVEEGYQQGFVSSRDWYKAQHSYYRMLIESGVKLNDVQQQHFRQLDKVVGGVSNMKAAWKGFERQVSTILTDFGRSVVDIFLPKFGLEQRAHDLASDVVGAFRKAFEGLSASGYADPTGALNTVIEKIRKAATLTDANRIATKHFGEMGPAIARGLRDGTIAADELAAALKEATNILHDDDQEKKVNKLNQLWRELTRTVARSFVEQAGGALAKFVGTHLKSLINSLDGIIQRIPIIGKGLAGIFGNTAGGAAGTIAGTIGGGVQTTIPNNGGIWGTPTGIPTTGGGSGPVGPTGSGGGGMSAASGWMGSVNMVSGVVGAVSSVIGNFQMAGMNKSLDLIEKAVRYTEYYTLRSVEEMMKYLPELLYIRTYFYDSFNPAFASLMTTVESLAARVAPQGAIAAAGGGDTYHITISGVSADGNTELAAATRNLVRIARNMQVVPVRG